jgi:hypothetical protein
VHLWGHILIIESHPISVLSNLADNPRSIDDASLEKLKKSILKLGQYEPILIWEKDSSRLVVIAGNQRLKAIRELLRDGNDVPKEIPCVRFTGTEKAARMICLRDNQSDGDWDWKTLPLYVSDLNEMASELQIDSDLFGFDEEDLKDLIEMSGNTSDMFNDQAAPDEDVADPNISDGDAKDTKRSRFARFVIGNVRGRVTIDQYGIWLQNFEKYSDRLGSTDIPLIMSAMLDDIEDKARFNRAN